LIADVVDKGASAALLMALCRTLIRSHADEHPDQPEQVLTATNSRILSDAGASRFVTVFFGALDPSSGVLSYCNAGHNPPELIRDTAPDRAQPLNKTGVPLGILEDQEWACAELQMDEGDVLVLYTDGVTEAQAANAEFYGSERLVEVVRANRNKRAEEINNEILRSIEQFRGESPPQDDMAILVVKRTRS
jgi:sigma-B regulation protein RsbU (phosphoserine phosphatase)